jgi:thioredoxin-related protein
MKTKFTLAISLFILILISSGFRTLNFTGDELAIGAKLPKSDLKMSDVGGKSYSLGDLKTAKGLLVIFSCNTCPYVKLSEARIKEYTDFCKANGIGAVIINSNEAQRDGDDSFAEMRKYAADQQLAIPYLTDAKSELADAFGASRTPQCFLFDKNASLFYKGAIDDNVKDAKAVKQSYLKDALNALIKGTAVTPAETKSIGCTIKRME